MAQRTISCSFGGRRPRAIKQKLCKGINLYRVSVSSKCFYKFSVSFTPLLSGGALSIRGFRGRICPAGDRKTNLSKKNMYLKEKSPFARFVDGLFMLKPIDLYSPNSSYLFYMQKTKKLFHKIREISKFFRKDSEGQNAPPIF